MTTIDRTLIDERTSYELHDAALTACGIHNEEILTDEDVACMYRNERYAEACMSAASLGLDPAEWGSHIANGGWNAITIG